VRDNPHPGDKISGTEHGAQLNSESIGETTHLMENSADQPRSTPDPNACTKQLARSQEPVHERAGNQGVGAVQPAVGDSLGVPSEDGLSESDKPSGSSGPRQAASDGTKSIRQADEQNGHIALRASTSTLLELEGVSPNRGISMGPGERPSDDSEPVVSAPLDDGHGQGSRSTTLADSLYVLLAHTGDSTTPLASHDAWGKPLASHDVRGGSLASHDARDHPTLASHDVRAQPLASHDARDPPYHRLRRMTLVAPHLRRMTLVAPHLRRMALVWTLPPKLQRL
jgi:hypothetical protein